MAVFSGNGSNTAPSFTFSSDTNLGFYRVDADTLAATTNGNKMFEVGTSYAGVGTAAAPPLGYSRHLYVTAGTTGDERSALIMQGSRTSNNTVNTIDFYHKANLVSQIEVIRGGADDAGSINISTREGGGSLTNRATFTQNGYLRMASGSGGIQFNGDTAAVNALDDYEQGSFTVSIVVDGNAGTTGTIPYLGNANYVKIGAMVVVTATLRSQPATPTGAVTLSGTLPFPPAGSTRPSFYVTASRALDINTSVTGNTVVVASSAINSSVLSIGTSNDNVDFTDALGSISTSDNRTTKLLMFGGVYYTG